MQSPATDSRAMPAGCGVIPKRLDVSSCGSGCEERRSGDHCVDVAITPGDHRRTRKFASSSKRKNPDEGISNGVVIVHIARLGKRIIEDGSKAQNSDSGRPVAWRIRAVALFNM